MSLAKKFDNRFRKNIALRAVWIPGTYIRLGDILRIKNGVFDSIGNISDYDVVFNESND